jgi:pilus assembly protein Flp/PilA
MRRTIKLIDQFLREEEGASLLEYGILILLIALLSIAALTTLGSKVSAGFTAANGALP